MGRVWRAYAASLAADPRQVLVLSAEESRHLLQVLRLRPGERVAVFDGRGREWLGTLLAPENDAARVRLDEEVATPIEPRLQVTLFQGVCRPAALDWAVQKATEIGVAAILPLASARSERLPEGARIARLARVALEAAKQCGRRVVPRIEPCAELPAPPAGVPALLLDPEPGSEPLRAHLECEPPRAVWLACGPEAGLAPQEVAAWHRAGWRRAALGPRILRAETAGIVAAAIVLHRWGDLAV